MARQRFGQLRDIYAEHVRRRPAGTGYPGVTEYSQPVRGPGLQGFEDGQLPSRHCGPRERPEDLVHYPRQLLGSFATRRDELQGRALDRRCRGAPQRTLLGSAAHENGQPLEARIREQSNQPCRKIVSNERHASLPDREQVKLITQAAESVTPTSWPPRASNVRDQGSAAGFRIFDDKLAALEIDREHRDKPRSEPEASPTCTD